MKNLLIDPIKSVLFDLDGTLLDTAPDLATALNKILAANDMPDLPVEAIRPVAGQGCKGLLKIGLAIEEHHPEYAGLSEQLLNFYQHHMHDQTTLFAGIEPVLAALEAANIPWGIVTNKPMRFTQPIIEHLNLSQRAACVISGDSLAYRKPHPAPLLHACHLLKCSPRNSLFIGDSIIDILAGNAAGIPSLAALYGYIPPEEDPLAWQATGCINEPLEILDWLAI